MRKLHFKGYGAALAVLLVAVVLSGCGTTEGSPLTIRNAANATAAPSPTATDFVLIWLLYGSPTPAPGHKLPGGQPVPIAIQPTDIPLPITATPIGWSPTVTPTPTPQPTATPTSGPGSSSSSGNGGGSGGSGGLVGDPVKGKAIFNGAGTCYSCHNVNNDQTLVGPGLKTIAKRAGTRISGVAADEYIRRTINKPDQVVLPGFAKGIMPQNFSKLLTKQQIEDLVAYLLSLK